MITIHDYETRFPKLNGEYFDSLSEDEKKLYLQRLEKYHSALLKMIIRLINLTNVEESLRKSSNHFQPVGVEKQDLYQLMSSDQLSFLYLRNNLYIERLSDEQLRILDSGEGIDTLVQDTFKDIIDDYPGKNMVTNYGPDSSSFYTNASNLILGVRIDDDYYPDGSNKVDLILSREYELDFLKSFLKSKIQQKCGIEGTVIQYTKYSVKLDETSYNGTTNMAMK